MFQTHEALFFYTESPLHAGSGSTVGVVDLPIQRERQTNHPIVQSRGVKGAIRSHCREGWGSSDTRLDAIFGPETNADAFGGAVSFSEARLLLFPVRSLRGVFAWITCPLALARFQRDMSRAGVALTGWSVPGSVGAGMALATAPGPLVVAGNNQAAQVVLEEYTFAVTPNSAPTVAALAKWLCDNAFPAPPAPAASAPPAAGNAAPLPPDPYKFWRDWLYTAGAGAASATSHLIVLDDDEFTEFVTNATDTNPHIKIDDDTGTVGNGALWVTEDLPAECLLYSVMHVRPPRSGKLPESAGGKTPDTLMVNGHPDAGKVRNEIASFLKTHDLMLMGGDETTHRGLLRVRTLSGAAAPTAPAAGTPAAPTEGNAHV